MNCIGNWSDNFIPFYISFMSFVDVPFDGPHDNTDCCGLGVHSVVCINK